jgi:hypothetical protein
MCISKTHASYRRVRLGWLCMASASFGRSDLRARFKCLAKSSGCGHLRMWTDGSVYLCCIKIVCSITRLVPIIRLVMYKSNFCPIGWTWCLPVVSK